MEELDLKELFNIFWNKRVQILLIVLICILGIYIMLRRQGIGNENRYEYIEEMKPEEKIAIVDVRNHYYIVQSCVNKYYTYNAILSNINEYYGEEREEVIKEATTDNANILYARQRICRK